MRYVASELPVVDQNVTTTFCSLRSPPPFAQLEQMCQKQKPSLAEATTTDVEKEDIQSILDLLEPESQQEEAASPLKALHLVAGAMDGERVLKKTTNLSVS